ncbi:SDR family NAD(P)-dependent oxidoreductase [Loktanella sp. SALINAS62]|uniref:SDR family NAD(P)-dependent oxidoreductase n=1 Tax=Loktanella sp. SALINAS62 TaxID=2706124 RepID=UPI001B8C2D7B|nr:SDR family NAD(P)-dependent oxidoreductase [Loktanella sp. SALINAS62]MBS1303221.1 SDR family NAD(P)-dependent oxidoreductase [Loktanella sp. SALINAS62]
MTRKLAVITGASTGLGYQLARLAAQDGHDLIIVADEDAIHTAADKLRRLGAAVDAQVIDLSGRQGVTAFWDMIGEREVDLFVLNAGRALGHAFDEQDWPDVKRLVDLNILQTTSVLHTAGTRMHKRGTGRILLTGSIGGYVPGPFDAIYNATKAYLDSLCYALQEEWKDSEVTLTCLMPGPTETPLFQRDDNDLQEAPITGKAKYDPVMVAEQGYAAAMSGARRAVPGFASKVITMFASIVPDEMLSRIHRRGADPVED